MTTTESAAPSAQDLLDELIGACRQLEYTTGHHSLVAVIPRSDWDEFKTKYDRITRANSAAMLRDQERRMSES